MAITNLECLIIFVSATVLSDFESLNSTDMGVMQSFVDANFDGPAIEFSPWVPPDWQLRYTEITQPNFIATKHTKLLSMKFLPR